MNETRLDLPALGVRRPLLALVLNLLSLYVLWVHQSRAWTTDRPDRLNRSCVASAVGRADLADPVAWRPAPRTADRLCLKCFP